MFKINGDNWRVVFVSPYHPMLKKKDGSYTLGACVDDTKKIYINNNITQQTIADMQNANTINAGITSLGTQLQQCCCQNRYEDAQNFAQLNYNLADQECSTRRAVSDATRRNV